MHDEQKRKIDTLDKVTWKKLTGKATSNVGHPEKVELSELIEAICGIAIFFHCVESFQIKKFFWSVFSCVLTEYGKIRTRKNSVFEQFSHSVHPYISDSEMKS